MVNHRPLTCVMRSSIRGREYFSATVISFNLVNLTHGCSDPSFLVISTKGDANGESEGLMMPSASILSKIVSTCAMAIL